MRYTVTVVNQHGDYIDRLITNSPKAAALFKRSWERRPHKTQRYTAAIERHPD
jgi:hypothetical protein